MKQIEAIKYLCEHSEYRDEWTGAGMWEAVEKIMKLKGRYSKKRLKELLEEAKNR